jgi:hypothetical protein
MNAGKRAPSIVLPLLLFLLLGLLPERAFSRGKNDVLPAPAQGQTRAPAESGSAEWPLWARDLRRADIIAFGSFPFTFFLASTIMDSYRWAQNDGDRRYAPWPVKSAGSVNMTKDETNIVIGAAAGGSILLALADFLIVHAKRSRAEREAAGRPAGDPIIIRRPWPEGDASPLSGGEETPAVSAVPSGPAPEEARGENGEAASPGAGGP